MPMPFTRRLLLCVALALATGPALATEKAASTLQVVSPKGLAKVVEALATDFQQQANVKVVVHGVDEDGVESHLRQRPGADGDIDLVIARRSTIDTLVAEHKVMRDSRVDLGKSLIALAVRNGAPSPAIDSVATLRETLLQANSVATSTSGSGVYISHWLLPRLKLGDAFKSGARVQAVDSVGEAIASGMAQLGLEQVSKLQGIEGIRIVGLIPDELQQMVVYSGAVAEDTAHLAQSEALLAYLREANEGKALVAIGL